MRADPAQRDLMELPPVASRRLDQHARLLIRDADAALIALPSAL